MRPNATRIKAEVQPDVSNIAVNMHVAYAEMHSLQLVQALMLPENEGERQKVNIINKKYNNMTCL